MWRRPGAETAGSGEQDTCQIFVIGAAAIVPRGAMADSQTEEFRQAKGIRQRDRRA